MIPKNIQQTNAVSTITYEPVQFTTKQTTTTTFSTDQWNYDASHKGLLTKEDFLSEIGKPPSSSFTRDKTDFSGRPGSNYSELPSFQQTKLDIKVPESSVIGGPQSQFPTIPKGPSTLTFTKFSPTKPNEPPKTTVLFNSFPKFDSGESQGAPGAQIG